MSDACRRASLPDRLAGDRRGLPLAGLIVLLTGYVGYFGVLLAIAAAAVHPR
jgi:hypothetical protein